MLQLTILLNVTSVGTCLASRKCSGISYILRDVVDNLWNSDCFVSIPSFALLSIRPICAKQNGIVYTCRTRECIMIAVKHGTRFISIF
jgi:hypothetical protein